MEIQAGFCKQSFRVVILPIPADKKGADNQDKEKNGQNFQEQNQENDLGDANRCRCAVAEAQQPCDCRNE
jgi:hypothetical protein